MKTYIRRQQHKKKKFKHQDIKQKEPPQKYRLGMISNTKLLAGLNRFYRRKLVFPQFKQTFYYGHFFSSSNDNLHFLIASRELELSL